MWGGYLKITIKEVALEAGVSTATVSRVISGNSRISGATTKKVLEVMDRLGYHPNQIARSLVSQSTRIIGVVMPGATRETLANPFFPEALRGISDAASKKNYFVLLSVQEDDDDMKFEDLIRKGMVDGIIMLYSKTEDKFFEALKVRKFPFVMVGKPQKHGKFSYVDNDNVAASYEATEHLIKKDRKRIAMVTGPKDLMVSLDRYEGYKRALFDNGMEIDENLIIYTAFSAKGGELATEELLALEQRPDGILFADDIQAMGAIRVFKKHGVKIPKDVAILGFNNIPAAEFISPSLTSIEINPFELGFEAAEMLIDNLQKGKHGHYGHHARIIPTKIIQRSST